MAPGTDEPPQPVLERVTRIERKFGAVVLQRQYQNPGSFYRRNVRWYGDLATTYLVVANIWLLQAFPFIILIWVSSFVENGPLLLLALAVGFACIGAGTVRLYQAIRIGRDWRQENGVGRPPRWRSRTPFEPPEGSETSPPIGWAQTSKVPPGWTDPDKGY